MIRTVRLPAPTTLVGKLFLLTLAALLLATLAACGGSEPATPTPTPTEAAAVAAVVAPIPTPEVRETIPIQQSQPPQAAEKPVYGGTIRSVKGLGSPDPYHISLPSSSWGRAFYNNLVELKFPYEEAKGPQFVPGLAEWSQSQDGTKWTLKLRQGVTFHDGELFNADDVVATFERALDRSVLIQARIASIRNIFSGGAKKIDDYTVVMNTETPNASALPYLAYEAVTMMPEHLIRGDRNATDPKLRWRFMHPDKGNPQNTGTLAVGTGPFIMKKWDPEVETIGERNSNYWGQDSQGNRLPYLDRIEYRKINDPIRANANFLAGQISIAFGNCCGMNPKTATQLCRLNKQAGCYLSQTLPHGAFEWFVNPAGVGVFKDDRVVQAARYASDHQASIDVAYGGGEGFMWMNRIRYPDTTLTVKEQYELLPWSDPARRPEFLKKAKDLIADAGYPNGIDLPLPIYTSAPCFGTFLDHFSHEVDQFYRAGLKSFLECRAGIIANDELKAGRWSLANSAASIAFVDPGVMVFSKLLLDSPAVGLAQFRYAGQEIIDAKFRQILKEVDQAKRNEGYRALERHLANDKLTVWSIGYTSVVLVVQGCVHNFKPGGTFASNDMALIFAWVTPECK